MDKVCGNGAATWDKAVLDASEEYKCRTVGTIFKKFFNTHVSILTFINLVFFYVVIEAQSMHGQLPFPRCYGPKPHALRQQYVLEHGEPVCAVSHQWETCEVRITASFCCFLSCLEVNMLIPILGSKKIVNTDIS